MNLLSIATRLFKQKLGAVGGGLDADTVSSALSALLGNGRGDIDLAGLLARLDGGGLAALAQSWLGDGANAGLSASQLMGVFKSGELADFATRLGLDTSTASTGLAGMLPELIDQHSKGGNLLDAVGGASGLLGAASKLFK